MPSSFWVASTKPGAALARRQGWTPWQGRGWSLAPRDRGPGPRRTLPVTPLFLDDDAGGRQHAGGTGLRGQRHLRRRRPDGDREARAEQLERGRAALDRRRFRHRNRDLLAGLRELAASRPLAHLVYLQRELLAERRRHPPRQRQCEGASSFGREEQAARPEQVLVRVGETAASGVHLE